MWAWRRQTRDRATAAGSGGAKNLAVMRCLRVDHRPDSRQPVALRKFHRASAPRPPVHVRIAPAPASPPALPPPAATYINSACRAAMRTAAGAARRSAVCEGPGAGRQAKHAAAPRSSSAQPRRGVQQSATRLAAVKSPLDAVSIATAGPDLYFLIHSAGSTEPAASAFALPAPTAVAAGGTPTRAGCRVGLLRITHNRAPVLIAKPRLRAAVTEVSKAVRERGVAAPDAQRSFVARDGALPRLPPPQSRMLHPLPTCRDALIPRC